MIHFIYCADCCDVDSNCFNCQGKGVTLNTGVALNEMKCINCSLNRDSKCPCFNILTHDDDFCSKFERK